MAKQPALLYDYYECPQCGRVTEERQINLGGKSINTCHYVRATQRHRPLIFNHQRHRDFKDCPGAREEANLRQFERPLTPYELRYLKSHPPTRWLRPSIIVREWMWGRNKKDWKNVCVYVEPSRKPCPPAVSPATPVMVSDG